jgi:hypothetical protein
MSQVRFEHNFLVFLPTKTVHSLDCAATVIGLKFIITKENRTTDITLETEKF